MKCLEFIATLWNLGWIAPIRRSRCLSIGQPPSCLSLARLMDQILIEALSSDFKTLPLFSFLTSLLAYSIFQNIVLSIPLVLVHHNSYMQNLPVRAHLSSAHARGNFPLLPSNPRELMVKGTFHFPRTNLPEMAQGIPDLVG